MSPRVQKDANKKKSLRELGVIAKVLLNRDRDFDPATIMHWKRNKDRIRDQALAYGKRSKFDPRGQIKPVKNLASAEEFQFTEDLQVKYRC